MERYEIRVKYDEINRLAEQKRYEEAMQIANTVDWDRAKNVNMLCVAGEVFERCGYFEDSKAIYLRAYQFQPKSRIIVYRLAELSIKLGDYEDSIHYYKSYEEIAPQDANLYVLRYKIYQARGAANEILIRILQELKDVDYHERWAYELAKLYAESGLIDMCVAECDEINLWFGNGKYVCKALQLKKRYQALTREQQKKLDDFTAARQPNRAAETIADGERARRLWKEKTDEFVSLRDELEGQEESRGSDASVQSEQHRQERPRTDKQEHMERARKEALEEAQKARAAQLLQEAAAEARREANRQEPQPENDKPSVRRAMPGVEVTAPAEELQVVGGAPRRQKPQTGAEEGIPSRERADKLKRQEDPVKPETPVMDIKPEPNSGPSDGDLLAERIALALQGKLPPEQPVKRSYEDDFIRDTVREDDYIEHGGADKDSFVGTLSEQDLDLFDDFYEESDSAQKSADDSDEDDLEFLDDEYDSAEEKFDEEYDDDVTEDDEQSFQKKESAFRKVWRKTSDALRKEKPVTRMANQPDYDVQIQPVVVNRYDTLNLQKELAQSIRDILDATEKDDVEKTLENINRSMEESNIPRLIQTKRLNVHPESEDAPDEEKAGEAEPENGMTSAGFLREVLDEEYDGQIRLLIDEKPVERQITGQISLEQLLAEQEKTQLEDAKRKALEQAGGYIQQLTAVVPFMEDHEIIEITDGDAEDQIHSDERMELDEAAQEKPEEALEEVRSEVDDMKEIQNEELYQKLQALFGIDHPTREQIARMIADLSGLLVEMESALGEELAAQEVAATLEPEEPESEPAAEEPQEPEDEAAAEELQEPENEPVAEAPQEPENEPAAEEPQEPENEPAAEEPEEPAEAEVLERRTVSEEQRNVMSYFMQVDGVERMIVDFLERPADHRENLLITGVKGSGKTSLALRLVKAVSQKDDPTSRRIAKVPAASLNQKPLKAVFEKVGSGTLIIEDAGLLSVEVCEHLVPLLDAYAKALRVILVGEKSSLDQMMKEIPSLKEKFSYQFDLPSYTNDELVEFGKSYAYTKGYVMDELAVLALYTTIAEEKNSDRSVMLGDMKRIIDGAIDRCEEKRGKKLFGGLFGKHVDDEGNIILKETDFEVE